jgi:hypothetical protein
MKSKKDQRYVLALPSRRTELTVDLDTRTVEKTAIARCKGKRLAQRADREKGGFGDDRQGIAALPGIPHPIGFGRADKLNTFNQQNLV